MHRQLPEANLSKLCIWRLNKNVYNTYSNVPPRTDKFLSIASTEAQSGYCHYPSPYPNVEHGHISKVVFVCLEIFSFIWC